MTTSHDPSSYALSDADNEEIFQTLIWPLISSRARPSASPRAIFVGGQPASGKTGIRSSAIQEVAGIVIDGDDLRCFHPKFDLIKRQNPDLLTACTGPDSARWIEKCIAAAMHAHISVAIETTMRSPRVVIDTINAFKDNGFYVELNVVAVKPMITWRRCCFRRELMLKHGTAVRNVAKEIHDAAALGVIQTVNLVETIGSAQVSRIYDLEGRLIFDRERKSRGVASKILHEEHQRRLTLVESLAHDFTWAEIIEMMRARGAIPADLQEAEGYRVLDAKENRLI